MSGKKNKLYRKAVRSTGSLAIATRVTRAGREVRRRTLLRAWAKDRQELKTMREKLVGGRHGPARLFLADTN